MTDDDNPVGAELLRGDPGDLHPGKEPPRTEAERKKAKKAEAEGAGRDGIADMAARVVEAYELMADAGGQVHWWNRRHWEPVSDHVVKAWIFETCGGRTKNAIRQEILYYLMASRLKFPLEWGRVGLGEIPFANGVLDLASMELRPHSPDDLLDRALPVAWRGRLIEGSREEGEEGPGCPQWLAALEEWFGLEDEGLEIVGALQEFFGYCLMSHAKYKKALILHGESDSGKSVPLHVLRHLVGPSYCCSLTLDKMGDPAACSALVGRALNVLTELDSEARLADGPFKTLVSTEEPIEVKRMYKDPINYLPTAKHVFSTNKLPRVDDRSKAVFNRLLIVPMTKVIPREKQDMSLPDRLLGELEGIAAWAAEGARRLDARGGRWPEPALHHQVLQRYEEEQNPAAEFVKACGVPAPIEEHDAWRVPMASVVKVYHDWSGSKRMGGKALTGRLKQLGLTVKPARTSDDRIVSCLFGFKEFSVPSEMSLESVKHERGWGG